MAVAADVQHLVAAEEAIDLVGDEALVPGAPSGIDAGFPGRTRGLAAKPFPGIGQSRTGKQSARPRDGATWKVDGGGTLPFGLEQGPHALDRCRYPRHQMDTILRISEGERNCLGELPGAPVAQQQAPGVEGPRHDGRQQAGAGDQVEAQMLEGFDGGGARRGTLAANDALPPGLGIVKYDW